MESEFLVEFIRNRFKNRVNETQLIALVKIGEFVVKHIEDGSLTWDSNEAYEKYNELVPLTMEIGQPDKKSFKLLYNDSQVNQMLLDMLINTKHATLRKIIDNLGKQKDISQGDMKALSSLEKLITEKSSEKQPLRYIQYNSNVIYEQEQDDEKIILSFSKDTSDERQE